jgi:hypothetical protein
MHAKINQKRRELQMDLDRFHEQIEARKDYYKNILTNRMETRVSWVLQEQLQQAEINGAKVDKARNEFDQLQELFNLLNSKSLIDMLNVEQNHIDLNAPRLVFPSVTVDGFDWMENFYMENTVEIMEYSDQQQVDIKESTNYQRGTGNYSPDL